jgi:hypothetical protein
MTRALHCKVLVKFVNSGIYAFANYDHSCRDLLGVHPLAFWRLSLTLSAFVEGGV